MENIVDCTRIAHAEFMYGLIMGKRSMSKDTEMSLDKALAEFEKINYESFRRIMDSSKDFYVVFSNMALHKLAEDSALKGLYHRAYMLDNALRLIRVGRKRKLMIDEDMLDAYLESDPNCV